MRTTPLVTLPALDTQDIKAKLEAVASEVIANDPALLKKRIADLERLLRDGETAPTQPADAEEIAREHQRGVREGFRAGFDSAFAMGVNSLSEAWLQVLATISPIKNAIEGLEAFIDDGFNTVDGRSNKEKGGGTLADAPPEAWHRYDAGAPNDVATALDAALSEIETGSPPARAGGSRAACIPEGPSPRRAETVAPTGKERARIVNGKPLSPAQNAHPGRAGPWPGRVHGA